MTQYIYSPESVVVNGGPPPTTYTNGRTMPEPEHSIEMITPAKAAEYLKLNTRNRPMRADQVASYARDMTAGKWKWNGQPISFAPGLLLDGQNRLAAIISAGVPVRMLVVRGLEPDAQETIDAGKKRLFSEALQMREESNYSTLAAMTRAIVMYRSRWAIKVPSAADMLALLEEFPFLREGAAPVNRATAKAYLPAGVGGICWWLFADRETELQGDLTWVLGFFHELAADTDHPKGDPTLALRRYLGEIHDKKRPSPTRHTMIAVTIKAWNAFRFGKSITRVQFIDGEAFPVVR